MKDFKEKVDAVMANFDWKRVHKVMTLLDWEWYDAGVPTIPQMKECVERLFEDAWDYLEEEKEFPTGNSWRIETGGFRVTIDGDSLELAFILESSESEINKSEDDGIQRPLNFGKK